jgi:hypothetical protein
MIKAVPLKLVSWFLYVYLGWSYILQTPNTHLLSSKFSSHAIGKYNMMSLSVKKRGNFGLPQSVKRNNWTSLVGAASKFSNGVFSARSLRNHIRNYVPFWIPSEAMLHLKCLFLWKSWTWNRHKAISMRA